VSAGAVKAPHPIEKVLADLRAAGERTRAAPIWEKPRHAEQLGALAIDAIEQLTARTRDLERRLDELDRVGIAIGRAL
jgi:hypothetical protein